MGLTAVLGGGASSAVGQTAGVEGRCGGITGSLVVLSLSVSFFIEKELCKQLKDETKEEGRKIGERDIVSSTQDGGHAYVA